MDAKAARESINNEAWPSLPLEAWQDTYATLHMWTQIVGKLRLRTFATGKPLVALRTLRLCSRPHNAADALS